MFRLAPRMWEVFINLKYYASTFSGIVIPGLSLFTASIPHIMFTGHLLSLILLTERFYGKNSIQSYSASAVTSTFSRGEGSLMAYRKIYTATGTPSKTPQRPKIVWPMYRMIRTKTGFILSTAETILGFKTYVSRVCTRMIMIIARKTKLIPPLLKASRKIGAEEIKVPRTGTSPAKKTIVASTTMG